MLVHKATMGVLDLVWSGEYKADPDGVSYPVMQSVRLRDHPELSPEAWWEIKRSSPLARKIRQYYPDITPQIGPDGELVDVTPLCSEEKREAMEQAKERKAAIEQEAAQRGYRRAGKVRPLGLFGFLGCTPECNKAAKTQDE